MSLPGGPHLWQFNRFRNKPKTDFQRGKNISKWNKNPGNFVEIGNPIWNTFFIATSSKSPQILSYSKDFETNLS
jgi:hypothetical protein